MSETMVATQQAHSFSWVDPDATLRRLMLVDGLTAMRSLVDGEVEQSPIACALGMVFRQAERGRLVVELGLREFHRTHTHLVHGGVIATLCDTACGYATQTWLPAGGYPVSADLHTRMLRPVSVESGPLTCVGTAREPAGRRTIAQAEVFDAAGRLVAHATSTMFVREASV